MGGFRSFLVILGRFGVVLGRFEVILGRLGVILGHLLLLFMVRLPVSLILANQNWYHF